MAVSLKDLDHVPMVSVLMPVRNEGDFIRVSLDAVVAQDYPSDRVEIFVIDGMSTDSTRDVIASYQQKHPNIFLLDNPGKIVPKGMNVAIPRARGEILVRVDGHCKIASDYVRRCVDHLRDGQVDGVGGAVNTIGETGIARVIAVAMSSPFGVGGSAFRTMSNTTMIADTVPFPAYSRAIVERAGLYDEELVRNQDDEYNYRLRKLGARLLLAADVRSDYYSRSSIRSLWRQYYQYGYWKVRVMQKHPRQMSLRQFVPSVFVAALGFSLIAACIPGTGGVWLPLVVLGAYVCANLTATMLTMVKKKANLLPMLPVAFAALHFSYGCGFLAGLVRFRSRWNRQAESTTISHVHHDAQTL